MKRALLLVVLLSPALASAQGLGDAARRERQKRVTEPSKQDPRIYDNDDLNAGKPATKPGEPAAAAPSTPPAPAPDEPSADDAREAQMLERVAAAEKRLAEAEVSLETAKARVQQLKDKLNPMSPSFVLGAASAGMAAPGAEMRVREELQQAEADQIEVQKTVDDARRALDEARVRRPSSDAR